MGDPFVGIVHPCKIYNVLLLGIPVLYIGPAQGHVPDLAPTESSWFHRAAHGDVGAVVEHILAAASSSQVESSEQRQIASAFTADALIRKLIVSMETLPAIVSNGRSRNLPAVGPEVDV
jgi:hypothetical protein